MNFAPDDLQLNFTLYNNVTIMDILYAIIIIGFSVVLSKLISIYSRRTFRDKIAMDHLEVIITAISYLIYILAFIFILPIVGINPAGLLVAGGILAIVIGFSTQSIVGNLISGIFLMIERPVKIGDTVNIHDVTGIVEEIRIISTSIRTFDGVYVRIPNEKVFTGNITNYVTNVARRFSYMIGINYRDDAEKAMEIITQVIDDEPFALRNPPPSVFVHNLGDNSMNISIRIWAPAQEWWDIRTKLLWVIKKTLEENGFEIPFPQRTISYLEEPESKHLNIKEYRELHNGRSTEEDIL